jgi:hypothetical protein
MEEGGVMSPEGFIGAGEEVDDFEVVLEEVVDELEGVEEGVEALGEWGS